MKIASYRKQVVMFVIWIFAVMALFRLIADRQIAALITGAGFILLSVAVLLMEWRGRRNRFHISIILLFLILSAIPIFTVRVVNWGVEFASISIAGVPASEFHRFSTYTYLAMLISALVLAHREKAK